jgi:methionyl-tRNA formyltransferase
MKIHYLGPESPLISFLQGEGNVVIQTEERTIPAGDADCIVSYGYRYLIPQSAIDTVERKAINLHISYLPWNRGANPNYWSWYDGTPKGVTIHYIDQHLDTGDIIAQQIVNIPENATLASSYGLLKNAIEALFMQIWPHLFDISRTRQSTEGSYHSSNEVLYLPKGWETSCALIKSIGKTERIYRDREMSAPL